MTTKKKTKPIFPIFDRGSDYQVSTDWLTAEIDRMSIHSILHFIRGSREMNKDLMRLVIYRLWDKDPRFDDNGNDISKEFWTAENLFGKEFKDVLD